MELFKKYRIQERKKKLVETIDLLHELKEKIQNDLIFETLEQIREHSANPFTFVIVGEVKAGKSSFINALLESEKEICKVAPSPMTDTIQLITYDQIEREEIINAYFKKIYLPIPILKDIGIVDTPGTNTIIEHHQEITERFIPSSDLIVFVFEAKNPYRESAWKFFDYIHAEWRKKIIFILQQKDLLSETDLQINVKGVEEHAHKKGIDDPQIFAVSAKTELKGDSSTSGFNTVRAYIRDHITDGKAPVLKLQNGIEAVQKLVTKIDDALTQRKSDNQRDINFRNEISTHLEKQSEKSNQQAKIFTENIVAAYHSISKKYENELKSGLSFMTLLKRSFSSIFGSKDSIKTWIDELNSSFEKELNGELKMKLSEGIVHLSDSVQQMGLLIDLKLKDSPSLTKGGNALFQDIHDKRKKIMENLHVSFNQFLKDTDNFIERQDQEEHNISPNIATGSGIAVIGVILTTVASGLVFDITGGVLTAVGLTFAGVSASLKRNKIVKQFRSEVEKGEIQLEQKLMDKLTSYIADLREKIDQQFYGLDKLIEDEQKEIANIQNVIDQANQELSTLRAELKL